MKRIEVGRSIGTNTATHRDLEISLLGEFSFSFCGHPVAGSAWQRAHARRLIQLLCSSPKLCESRSRLLEALWPGFDDDRARNRLHHTIHCIRKALNDIPVQSRPQIVVGGDSIEFIPSPSTAIDVQVFIHSLDEDCALAEERLNCLEQALNLFRGELAPEWDDCSEIEARRGWLAKKRESALREAIDIAVELNRLTDALSHARHLASLLETDGAAHCQYALLLAKTGRADAALLYCNDVLSTLRLDSPHSAPEIEETILLIQKNANQYQAAAKAGVAVESNSSSAAPGLLLRLSVAAPEHELLGYESVVQECVDQIGDPFCTYISLLAPPGAGKSLLAATVAHRHQSNMRHGAIWIDCSWITNSQELVETLARALEPLSGSLADDCGGVCQILQNKELLVVLDGLRPSAELVKLIHKIGACCREVRWLVTAWNALHLQGERLLHMESWQLTVAPENGGLSPAAKIIQSCKPTTRRLQDIYSLRLMERIVKDLDGLPLSLVIAADRLSSMSPNELWSRLQRDPAMLLRSGPNQPSSEVVRLLNSVQTWFEQATPSERTMLSLLSRCKSWLTREDIVQLLGAEDTNFVDNLIHDCVRRQFLLRRSQGHVPCPWSEFRVAKIVTAALRMNNVPTDPGHFQHRIESWLFNRRSGDFKVGGPSATHWFDRHIDDLDATAHQWIEMGKVSQLAQLCAAHAQAWSAERHCHLVLPWLSALGDTMQNVESELAPMLLIERARLRVHLGQFDLACDDASHALERLSTAPNPALELQAVQLIRRYGISDRKAPQQEPQLAERGLEVGEGLLRIGRLAIRHGQLNHALAVCSQASDVFKFFDLPYGQLKALQYRAKISFAMGDLELTEHCIEQIEHHATKNNDRRSAFNAYQLRANVLLSRMQFAQAINLVSDLISKPDSAVDEVASARAMAIIAWAHYGQGVFPMAMALCKTLVESAKRSGDLRLRLSVETLLALVQARSGQDRAATRSACAAVDLIVSRQPLEDIQVDMVNVAELAMHMKRDDLSRPMIHSLKLFAEQPKLKLRPWTLHRMQEVSVLLRPSKETFHITPPTMTATDVLKELAMSYNAVVIPSRPEPSQPFEVIQTTPGRYSRRSTDANAGAWKISA
ncbi:MAG: BTAD domain-containing putative transcriptional regulator [Burkholderiaceae bacterium]